MQDNQPKVETVKAYKFKKELFDSIYDFLNTRPYKETEQIIRELFESGTYESIYMSQQGLDVITQYLMSCPRKEVKDVINMLKDEKSLYVFDIPANQVSGAVDVSDKSAETKSADVSDLPPAPPADSQIL